MASVEASAADASTRSRVFRKPGDYEALEALLEETLASRPMCVCGFCLMPDHGHLVPWPEKEGRLGAFLQRLAITPLTHWRQRRHRVCEGHLHQGRFQSFPVASDEHHDQHPRYVERSALRAQLAETAESWRWGSFWRPVHGTAEQRALLSPWPLPKPRDWTKRIHAREPAIERQAIRKRVPRGQPFGGETWVRATAERPGLPSPLGGRGRPRLAPPVG